MQKTLLLGALLMAALTLGFACAPLEPLPTEPAVDLDRFMGDWYVQGHVPVGSESTAHNAVESYARDGEGSSKILTSYVFRKKGFEGELKTMEPVGFVEDQATNATWGMRFIWPFKAEYLIAHVDDEYTETIIARRKRDYAWIMTRSPEISNEAYARLADQLVELGYEREEIRRVPQRWPDAEHPVSRGDGDMARFTRRK